MCVSLKDYASLGQHVKLGMKFKTLFEATFKVKYKLKVYIPHHQLNVSQAQVSFSFVTPLLLDSHVECWHLSVLSFAPNSEKNVIQVCCILHWFLFCFL